MSVLTWLVTWQLCHLASATSSGPETRTSALGAFQLPRTASQYSVHACFGAPHQFNAEKVEQSCRFHHVCLDHETREFVYFLDPAAKGAYMDAHGNSHDAFPEDFVPSDSIAPWYIPAYGDLAPHYFSPKVVRGSVPSTATYVNYTEAPVHVLLSPRGPWYNFGHVMYDAIQPVFDLLSGFGMYTPDFQLLYYLHDDDYWNSKLRGLQKLFTGPEDKNLLRLISKHNLIMYGDVMATEDGASHTCFYTLLVGARLHNPYWTVQGYSAADLRAAILSNLALPHQPPPHEAGHLPRIIVLNKKNQRSINNLDQLVAAVERTHPAVHLRVLGSDELEGLSLREQVELMSSTTVLVSPPGGALAMGMFMAPGASVVTLNSPLEGDRPHNIMMDALPLAKWTHLHVESVPTTAADVLLPPEHDCPNLEADGVKNCDFWLQEGTIEEVVTAVGRGLALWRLHYPGEQGEQGEQPGEPGEQPGQQPAVRRH